MDWRLEEKAMRQQNEALGRVKEVLWQKIKSNCCENFKVKFIKLSHHNYVDEEHSLTGLRLKLVVIYNE